LSLVLKVSLCNCVVYVASFMVSVLVKMIWLFNYFIYDNVRHPKYNMEFLPFGRKTYCHRELLLMPNLLKCFLLIGGS